METARRLKAEAGRPEDFWYPEMALREALEGESAGLRSRVAEQERQIEALEGEQHRLLRALRDNAARISEKGVRFLGLDPDQLLQVNAFATQLRDGVAMPLDDKSRALNRRLEEVEAEGGRRGERRRR